MREIGNSIGDSRHRLRHGVAGLGRQGGHEILCRLRYSAVAVLRLPVPQGSGGFELSVLLFPRGVAH